MYKVVTADAAGLVLAHDITRIIPGEKQFPVFRRGHIIQAEDIAVLLEMGKIEIYVGDPPLGEIHEEEAALRIASSACGPDLTWAQPSQGRLNIKTDQKGLLKIDVNRLKQVNSCNGFVLATLHNNCTVDKDQIIAGTRIVPLTIPEDQLITVEKICSSPTPLIEVKPFKVHKVGVVTTGNEVFQGKVKDASYPMLKKKLEPFGLAIMEQVVVPDDPRIIAKNIKLMQNKGMELIVVTGGMSVDSNDTTPQGIEQSGADIIQYGVPVLPASQFLLAYMGDTPVCGLPGGALVSRITTFDILLPRFMGKDRIERNDLIDLGHGGLCSECSICSYPKCPFGKN
ncbi:MAG: molybdopterin-binding protein [Bacillota bacterium]|nr:molybdopterin-binding protein [Bacillota bacterium]